jgi:integrase
MSSSEHRKRNLHRKSTPEVLPEVVRRSTSHDDKASHSERLGSHPLWVRLASFLSLRAPTTRTTYSGVVQEWCAFLGADVGTTNGAELFLAASDMHASAYRSWLMDRPGIQPRFKESLHVPEAQSRQREVMHRESQQSVRAQQKKTGLESTQANATIAKKFSALRRIYRMCIGASLGPTENPFDTDRVPPPPKESGKKRPTEMVPFSLVKEIIALPDKTTPKGIRDSALLAVLFGGGLRRSEAAALRIGDIRKTPQGTTFVVLRATKAQRDFNQAIPRWAATTLQLLIAQRTQEGAAAGDFLFVGYRGYAGKVPSREPISENGIYRLFRSYCLRVGVTDHVTPHSARATAITKLLADGIPHREVQEFSRHASVQMVEVYDKRRVGVDENPGKELEFE